MSTQEPAPHPEPNTPEPMPPLRRKQQLISFEKDGIHTIVATGAEQLSVLLVFLFLLCIGFGVWWATTGHDQPLKPQRHYSYTGNFSKKQPIKVGILHSQTGTMATSEMNVVDALTMAIAEINQKGGVLGHRIVPVFADGASRPSVFAKRAEELITRDKVLTIFGCWTSSSRKAVKHVVEKHKHLLMYPVQYEGLESSPHIFYLGAAPNQQLIPAIKWAFHVLKKRRFFLVGSDYIFPRAAHALIKEMLKELGGIVSGEHLIPLGSKRVGPAVDAIVKVRPDIILNTINGSTNLSFFTALRKAGITPKIAPTISFSIAESELVAMNVWEMIGDYAAWNYFQSLNLPNNRAFIRRFQRKFGSYRVLSDPMASAYTGFYLWAQAIERAKSLRLPAIIAALRKGQILAPEGMVKVHPKNHHLSKRSHIGQILDNGQFRIVWSSTKVIAPEPFPKMRMNRNWLRILSKLKQPTKPAPAKVRQRAPAWRAAVGKAPAGAKVKAAKQASPVRRAVATPRVAPARSAAKTPSQRRPAPSKAPRREPAPPKKSGAPPKKLPAPPKKPATPPKKPAAPPVAPASRPAAKAPGRKRPSTRTTPTPAPR